MQAAPVVANLAHPRRRPRSVRGNRPGPDRVELFESWQDSTPEAAPAGP
jgi:hypothetical protein